MVALDFLDHLSPSLKADAIAALVNANMTAADKKWTLRRIIKDKNNMEKCKKYLELMSKLQTCLEKVSVNDREDVRKLLTNQWMTVADKKAALKAISNNNTPFLMECITIISLLDLQQPAKEKLVLVQIPAIVDFTFLEGIPENVREDIKCIVLNSELKVEAQMEKIKQVISNKSQLNDCKRFLRKMQQETILFGKLPEEHRPEVAAILRETAIGLKEKMQILKDVLKKREDRQLCRVFLEENGINTSHEEDLKPENLNMEFLESGPDEMNILVLGETGVGKSTFINGIANYLQYRSLFDAKNSGNMEILISTYFTHSDENFNQMKIVCRAEDDGGNENFDYGKSSTLAAKTYVFKWDCAGKKRLIRLIDTPGVGDVAGFERDKQNFDNIFIHLADYKELHAVCILLKSNESKLNTQFTYCLGELLSRLHMSAIKNLLFCFTNTRSSLYRPGETIAVLEAFINDIEIQRNIQIPLNHSSLFCFDNESFRFLCALTQRAKFSDEEIDDYNGSWKQSVEEVFRFFTRVSQLGSHQVEDTLCINNVRMVFNLLARPMTDLNWKKETLEKVIADKIKELIRLREEIAVETPKLSVTRQSTVRRPTNRIDTVCSSACCSPADTLKPTETHYKICHEDCTCVQAKLNVCSDVQLQQCKYLNNDELKCSCGCPWIAHKQIDYELVVGTEEIVNPVVQNKIETLKAEEIRLNDEIDWDQQRRVTAYSENKKLVEQGAEYVAYLLKNAVLPYNTHKKGYLEKMIKDEKEKGQDKSEKDLLQLEHYQEEHSHQVALLDACKEDCKNGVEEMDQMITDSKDSRNWGPIQSDIDDMILLKPRNYQMIRCKSVDLNKGWIGEHLKQKTS